MSVNIQTGLGNQDAPKFDNDDASLNEGRRDSTIKVDIAEAPGDQAPQPPEQPAEDNLAPNPMLRFGAAEFISGGGVIDLAYRSALSTEQIPEPNLPPLNPVPINLIPVQGQAAAGVTTNFAQSIIMKNTTSTIPEQSAVSSAPEKVTLLPLP